MKENFAASKELLTIASITLKLSTESSYYVIAIVGSLDIFNKNCLN